MIRVAIFSLITVVFSSAFAGAAEEDRTFLLCDGVSRASSPITFSFTVTLDASDSKVLDIGTGSGAATETFTDTSIVGTQVVGNGVTNRLTIDRMTQAFTLEIIRAAREGEAPVESDVFSGRCGPTARPF